MRRQIFVNLILLYIIILINYNCYYSLDNGLGLTPAMGWNSWNAYGCNINETIVKNTADAMVNNGYLDAGYKYLIIDDCWMSYNRSINNTLIPDPIKFPSGIKSLSDYVHSKGLLFGIYSSAGNQTCEGRAASLYNEIIDANTFASWNVDFLKYDNCNNNNLPAIDRYTRMRDALNQTNRSIYYSICEWGEDSPWIWGKSTGNSWRNTPDMQANWNSIILTFYLNGPANSAGIGGWNDPDMLQIGNGNLTEDEQQTHMSLWSITKAPLIIGCNLNNISLLSYKILLNQEVININQDPLGIQADVRKIFHGGNSRIYGGPLINNNYVFAVINSGNIINNVTVYWNYFGLNKNDYYVLRDLWKLQNITTTSYSWNTLVQPHQTILIRMIPA